MRPYAVIRAEEQSVRAEIPEAGFPFEVFSAADSPPPRETQLTVIGFPKGLGVKGRFSPLTLQTLPASGLLSMKRFDVPIDTEFFMLQNP
jgi:hypothetical protein